MSKAGARVRFLIKLVVSAGLLTFLLSKISIAELSSVIAGLDPRIAGAAVTVFFISNLLGALQWHLLLGASGVSIRFQQSFRFYFVGLFFNNFLPANVGGDAVKVYDVSRVGCDVSQVVAVTLLDRIIGIFSLCFIALVSGLVLWRVHPVDSLGLYLVIFVGCMAPLLGFYLIEPLSKLVRALIARMRPLAVDRWGMAILDHLSAFKARRRLVMRLILLSLVVQALRVSTHVLVARALGVQFDGVVLLMFFVFVPLLGLAMVPPITINGLGIREAVGILLFSQAGIDRTDAFAIEFLTYLVSVLVSLIGLGFFLARRVRPDTNPDTTVI